MEDFKVRLLEERNQLKEKVEKLDLFLESETFEQLDLTLQMLMEDQFYAMEHYLDSLQSRIEYLKIEE